MNRRSLIFFGIMVGGGIGSFVASFFDGSVFSFASLFLSAVGSIFGIWVVFKVTQ